MPNGTTRIRGRKVRMFTRQTLHSGTTFTVFATMVLLAKGRALQQHQRTAQATLSSRPPIVARKQTLNLSSPADRADAKRSQELESAETGSGVKLGLLVKAKGESAVQRLGAKDGTAAAQRVLL
jgi:hypothetical protein